MKAHVLVVEDSQTQALRLRLMLQRAGLSTVVANTGHDGVAMAKELSPQVVVLDVNKTMGGRGTAPQTVARLAPGILSALHRRTNDCP